MFAPPRRASPPPRFYSRTRFSQIKKREKAWLVVRWGVVVEALFGSIKSTEREKNIIDVELSSGERKKERRRKNLMIFSWDEEEGRGRERRKKFGTKGGGRARGVIIIIFASPNFLHLPLWHIKLSARVRLIGRECVKIEANFVYKVHSRTLLYSKTNFLKNPSAKDCSDYHIVCPFFLLYGIAADDWLQEYQSSTVPLKPQPL